MDNPGWATKEKPIIVVKIPNAKDHPQFGSVCLLEMEKKISERPLNKKDSAKNIDSAKRELSGEVKTATLKTTNNIPTIKGMYQCFTEFLMELRKDGFMIFNFNG